jgi:hypothetical protein
MGNIQNCDSYINIPFSQTYRSYVYPFPSFTFQLITLSKLQIVRRKNDNLHWIGNGVEESG